MKSGSSGKLFSGASFPVASILLLSMCALATGCRPSPEAEPTSGSPPAERPAQTAEPVSGSGMQSVPDTGEVTLQVASGIVGKGDQAMNTRYLTDQAGAAVYALRDNRDGKRCDARCEEVWPPVLATTERPASGDGIRSEHLGALPHGNGAQQATYAGQPLYRYAGDSGRGRTAGHGVKDQWGAWSLVGTDGKPLSTQ